MSLGVDVGGSAVKWTLLEENGERAAEGSLPTPRTGPEAVVDAIGGLVVPEVQRIGVALPGHVDRARGTVLYVPALHGAAWPGYGLADRLATRTGVPRVTVVNDALSFGLAELRLGAAAGRQECLFVVLGTGVGGAVALGGRMLVGGRDSLGQIGHLTVDPEGPRCVCGNLGCVEAYAGARGLVAAYRRASAPARVEDGADEAARTADGAAETTQTADGAAEVAQTADGPAEVAQTPDGPAAPAADASRAAPDGPGARLPRSDPSRADAHRPQTPAPRDLTARDVAAAARAGDPAALAAFGSAGRALGRGLGDGLAVFGQQRVVVGGGLAGALPLLRPWVERELARRHELLGPCTVEPAALGPIAGAVGAALWAREAESRAAAPWAPDPRAPARSPATPPRQPTPDPSDSYEGAR
nr:ROK family protein [Streptomyces coryli]